jgi:hypothetical protein
LEQAWSNAGDALAICAPEERELTILRNILRERISGDERMMECKEVEGGTQVMQAIPGQNTEMIDNGGSASA